MKLLVIGNKARVEKYLPDLPVVERTDIVVAPRGASDVELLAMAADADCILADAISAVSADLIAAMPNLKLIHSEGVAFNAIDCKAARERGIDVCNNAGMNAAAVAEQAIMLMLACLRSAPEGDAAVRRGDQIQVKERLMVAGIRELGDCKVGFVGCGAIGRAAARRLALWGCEMLYCEIARLAPEDEASLKVSFSSLDEIARTCDIVSLHVPVTPATRNLVDAEFLHKMRSDAFLINTARGEIVDQEALAQAIEQGEIAGAGFDTLSPEPVQLDHPLLQLPDEYAHKVVLSPHIGGVTEGFFYRSHRNVWENIARLEEGMPCVNVVN